MKKLEDAKYCKYRSRNSRHKLMKKYHEHNWNYNMLRWKKKLGRKDYVDRLNNIRERRRRWNRHPADLKREIEEFRKRYGSHRSKWNTEQKAKYDKLESVLARRLRANNTYKGWKTYTRQQRKWDNSPVGKCLRARLDHFKWMKTHFAKMGVSERKRSYANVVHRCKQVRAHWLPFSDRGCMTMLDWEYGTVLVQERRFTKTDTKRDFNKLKHALNNSQKILSKSCMNWSFKRHAPHCKNYLQARLRVNSRKLNHEHMHDFDKKMMGNMMNNFERIYDTMMDERFWLNAPRDCGLGKEDAGSHRYHNKHGLNKWLEALKKFRWSHNKHNNWKNNWRKHHRHHWRRHGGHWNDRRNGHKGHYGRWGNNQRHRHRNGHRNWGRHHGHN